MMNKTIPEKLARQRDKVVGPMNKSHFIAEILREKIGGIQEHNLKKVIKPENRNVFPLP
jgi:hypothetical protein